MSSAESGSIARFEQGQAGLTLIQRAQQAGSVAELGFIFANETWQLTEYRQACFFTLDVFGKPALQTASSLASLEEDSPFTVWLTRLVKDWHARHADAAMRQLRIDDAETTLQDGWREWWPEQALWIPLHDRDGNRLGMLILVRESAWPEIDLQWLGLLQQTYAYCLQAMRAPSSGRVKRLLRAKSLRWIAGAMVLALCIPVRLSVLAPAEVIALQAEAVAAPIDGVVKRFEVLPNQAVKTGQLLFTLDDTTLRNRREVAARALAVAKADALAAQQKAFDSAQSRADLSTLEGKVRQREAELSYLDAMLERTEVRAEHDGIIAFSDANDWLGKPVTTGERIAQLANPRDKGVLVWLPVADAINLEPGADISLFLQVAPLQSHRARLVQTSYHASLSPDGVAAYRIRGAFQTQDDDARIGLRGTAKIYGGRVPVAYWLLRRPLGAVRQWLGF